MTCLEAPRARSHANELTRLKPRWTFAGIIAGAQHSSDCHVSGHNCRSTCGGQESALVNPANGVLTPYDPDEAHALDFTYWDDELGAAQIENQALLGPRSTDFRYTIDHRTGRLRYPPFRGGGFGQSSAGHPHLHFSYTPWAGKITAPVHGPKVMTRAVRRRLMRLARTEARRRRVLTVTDQHPNRPGQQYLHGRDVAEVQAVLGRPIRNPYGPGTASAVGDLQEFFGARRTGVVDRRTWSLIIFIYLAHGFGY